MRLCVCSSHGRESYHKPAYSLSWTHTRALRRTLHSQNIGAFSIWFRAKTDRTNKPNIQFTYYENRYRCWNNIDVRQPTAEAGSFQPPTHQRMAVANKQKNKRKKNTKFLCCCIWFGEWKLHASMLCCVCVLLMLSKWIGDLAVVFTSHPDVHVCPFDNAPNAATTCHRSRIQYNRIFLSRFHFFFLCWAQNFSHIFCIIRMKISLLKCKLS